MLQALGWPEGAVLEDGAGAWVGARQLSEALRQAQDICQDPGIGLSVGRRVRPANLGQLGYALISCADLSDGMAHFERMQALICTQVRVSHHQRGPWLDLELSTMGDVPRDTQLWSLAMVARTAFARWVAGRELVAERIWMPCAAPDDPQGLWDFFRCPIEFDAAYARERVPAAWLSLPNPHADAQMHALMHSAVQARWQAWQDEGHGLSSLVRRCVSNALQSGSLPSLEDIVPAVQAHMPLSTRQIQRRLSAAGWTFKELVESVRREQVLHELRHTALSPADIAWRAAYAETGSLHRAVRRWTGQTPIEIRRASAHQAGGGAPAAGADAVPDADKVADTVAGPLAHDKLNP